MAKKPDVAVIGSGIFGLWTAWAALRRGLSVLLLDRAEAGAGASGGPVGALCPHAPDRWGPETSFHVRALHALPTALREIEAASGLSTGYRRAGRMQPLDSASRRDWGERFVAASARRWPKGAAAILPPDAAPGWVAPERSAHGLLHDGISARLDPGGTCRALHAACLARGAVVRGGTEVRALEPSRIETTAGPVDAPLIVLAAGAGSFSLLQGLGTRGGGGVKGQAALLDADAPAQPLLQGDGIYVVGHECGGIAVGSTSERQWAEASGTDHRLDELVARAQALCPVLRSAPIVRRWAGLRPRADGRQPMIGAVPRLTGVAVCTGGYKIGFGIAHLAGEAALAAAMGDRVELPESFAPAAAEGYSR